MKTNPYLPTTKTVIEQAGSNRGANRALPAIADWYAKSSIQDLEVETEDPEPGRAEALSRRFCEHGISATAFEARFEDRPADRFSNRRLVEAHVDDPAVLARIFHATLRTGSPIAGSILAVPPHGGLVGFSIAVQGDENDEKARLEAFFGRYAAITARTGADAVFALPTAAAVEDRYRLTLNTALTSNLGKLLVGRRPNASPLAATLDGTNLLPVFVVNTPERWQPPQQLALHVVEQPSIPIMPGEQFVVGEAGPDGIRLHLARLRKIDRQVQVQGSLALDAHAYVDALARAERQTSTRQNPTLMTD